MTRHEPSLEDASAGAAHRGAERQMMRCVALLQDLRQCSGEAREHGPLTCAVPLCQRHAKELAARVIEDHYDRAARYRASVALSVKHEQRVDRSKATIKRETSGKWSFEYRCPLPGGGTRKICRSGFARKLDAQRAVADIKAKAKATEDRNRLMEQLESWEAKHREMAAAADRAVQAEGLTLALAAHRERRERERARLVYYVVRPEGSIKIGTTWNIRSRMQAFLNVSPVTLLATHSGGQPAEAALHRRFRAFRLDGEWFAPAPELLSHIAHVQRRSGSSAPDLEIVPPPPTDADYPGGPS